MNLPLLLILFLLSLALPSFGSPDDILNIRKVLADYALTVDSGSISGKPDFSTFDKVFTNNVSFIFSGQSSPDCVRGLAKLETVFTKNYPPGTITQNVVTTESITLMGESASQAEATSYLTNTYFGQGHLTGQIATMYLKVTDSLVKTKLQGNGGWRIHLRIDQNIVRRLFSILRCIQLMLLTTSL